jgi:hypothetical protein
MIEAPADFPGTDEERRANRATHTFDPDEGRCYGCDCRQSGRVAQWPCGQEPPRVIIDGPEASTYLTVLKSV